VFENINRLRLEEKRSNYYFWGNKKSQHRNDKLDREFGTLLSEKIKCSILYGTKDPIPGGLKKFKKKKRV